MSGHRASCGCDLLQCFVTTETFFLYATTISQLTTVVLLDNVNLITLLSQALFRIAMMAIATVTPGSMGTCKQAVAAHLGFVPFQSQVELK